MLAFALSASVLGRLGGTTRFHRAAATTLSTKWRMSAR
jgi:hypothetical protein